MWTYLAEEIRPFDVDAVAPVKVLLGRCLEVLQKHDAGARDQDVDFAEFGNGLGDHLLNVLDASSVALDEEASLVADL